MNIIANWISVSPTVLFNENFNEAYQKCLSINKNGGSFDFKVSFLKLTKRIIKFSLPKYIENLITEEIISDIIDLVQSEDVIVIKMTVKTICHLIEKIYSTREMFIKNGLLEIVDEISNSSEEINEICKPLKMILQDLY